MRSVRYLAYLVILVPFCLGLAEPNRSPADARITAARKKLAAKPDVQSNNDLAFALCRKARDSQDPGVLNEADSALARSAALQPGNYEGRKLQTLLYLESGQFAKALQLAKELNHKVPDDIVNWGLLVDANIAFGNYDEAERDAQWILDLRPGSALGFEKAAALREIFGDLQGSIEFYNEANLRTSSNDADGHAWYLTRKAQLELAAGDAHEAEDVLRQAMLLFPDSQLARSTLAAIRQAQGRQDQAASLLESNYRCANTAQNLYAWAQALARSSRPESARALWDQFETQASADMKKTGVADVNLIFFYSDQKNDGAKALSLAVARSAKFHDCATLDALAWAFYRAGRYSDAKTQMDRVLAVGVRNPLYSFHAAEIAKGAKA